MQKTTTRDSIIRGLCPPERVAPTKRNGGSHRPDWLLSEPGIFSCAMASFANCSCSALAFSIVILNPPSVFWALPVSTQWHIHSECPSSNTNKKPAQILRFAESKKEPLPRKIPGKAAQNRVRKGSSPLILPKPFLISFFPTSKIGRKKTRKSLKLLGFSQRHLFGCSLMVDSTGLEPVTPCTSRAIRSYFSVF